MVELFGHGERVGRAAIIAAADGQRLAALPAVYVTQKLCRCDALPRGAVTAYEALGPHNLIDRLVEDGFEFKAD
jgi:hypothetical protein